MDIILVINNFSSMRIEDFKPNWLEATKEVTRTFIVRRLQDRIGLVVFAGEAHALAPLTTDHNFLNTLIVDINFDMIKSSDTAIGSVLAVATNRMRDIEHENNNRKHKATGVTQRCIT